MIVTLTPNPGLDYTLHVPSFQLDQTIRAIDAAWGMAGKATDVSWILGKLGIPNRALGFAAGSTGQRMENMLHERGVETDFVWVEGESRLNTVLVVAGDGQSTITSPSPHVSPEQVAECMTRYEAALEGASCVVMGGSLPSGVPVDFFVGAIQKARVHHVPVIFDSSGPALLEGIQGRPNLLKPNQAELYDLLGYEPASQQEVRQAAEKLCHEDGTNVIVTLSDDGAIAVFQEASYFIHPLPISVVSAAGAGDGVLAGMALAYSRHESVEYGLRHGFALAGAILKTLATADFEVGEYQELLSQINITVL